MGRKLEGLKSQWQWGVASETRKGLVLGMGYTEEELVSSDIIGMEYGSLLDATQTLAQKCGTHIYEVRVVAWYDNEYSYVSQMVRTLKYLKKFL